ncbi:probable ubiquitin-conjugating enzyme E2 23 [Durio zibethinus]|uniref:Probable ubiquitin-conjugating enzyme E2 23 n=1 Tax=Durio zibethinus TaxID=66656 RepID=A0A6P5Z792_DURZI|nr:probable ubiquitin-conjugating enzyme E2 23 [Durio zibethinus]
MMKMTKMMMMKRMVKMKAVMVLAIAILMRLIKCLCGDFQGDQIRVLWMDETELVQSIKNGTVVDRGFLHGDYVAATSDSTGQLGVVVDFNISVDLLAPYGSVIKDVSRVLVLLDSFLFLVVIDN